MSDIKITTIQRMRIRRAALAVLAAYALTSVHHLYGGVVDGVPARLLAPIGMGLPLVICLGALYWHRRTQSELALRLFATVAVVAFVLLLGIVHGAYAHAYKNGLALFNAPPVFYYALNPDEHYPPDNFFFELTGVLELVTAYFVGVSTLQLMRSSRRAHEDLKPIPESTA